MAKIVIAIPMSLTPEASAGINKSGRSSDSSPDSKRLPENLSDLYACSVARATHSCGTVEDSHLFPFLIGRRTTMFAGAKVALSLRTCYTFPSLSSTIYIN